MKKIFSCCFAAAVAALFFGCADSEPNTAAAETVIRALNQGHKSDSSNKLKQIGMAITMYMNDNNDKLPDGLTALMESGFMPGGKNYIASYDKTSTPAGSGKGIKSGNTSYAYLGRGLSGRSNSAIPVCIEKPWLLPEGENTLRVLVLDGSVKQITIPKVSAKSCEETVKIVAGDAGIQGDDLEQLLQNARRIDKNRKK